MLLLDIGNSRLKWSEAAANGALTPPQFAQHDGDIAATIAGLQLPRAQPVWVASVLGEDHEPAIATAIREATGAAPSFARVRQDLLKLHVAYEEPQRLGVDRWLTMLALWSRAPAEAFCVAGAGTALTFDAVDASGRHLGGLIAPGLTTAQRAVDASTRFAIRQAGKSGEKFAAGLGTDTEGCVRQGALHACVGLIERASRNLQGAKYLTGGDAATLLPHLGRGWEWRPNAVLDGLKVLACS
jgi:type III pantothenate kinase